MLKFGDVPMLECSSKGDRRFSAFYARVRSRGNRSIEELYQAAKQFSDGTTNLSVKDAKGKVCVNIEAVRNFYSQLWIDYLNENPELLSVICQYKGFSDIFGQPGHACQAEEIWHVWCALEDSVVGNG